HVAYIIPKNGMSTESATITGTLMKGSNSNGNSPTVKIFEVLESNKELPKSVYANITDTNTFKDVTSQMKDNLTVSENGSYSL
ncbi:fibrinogen-binding adhesin SdrG C-terminal domain-containing protein, partial [Staphylococcus aureus]|nr:fibrinogen-binding adhesin SdrG C-terminal domain-containing protein [Staphylococcus aureus]